MAAGFFGAIAIHRTNGGRFLRAAMLLGGAGFAALALLSPTEPVRAAEPSPVYEDLVAANRILAQEHVVDSFGHVSVRDPADPNRFLMAQAKSPERICPADIMSFDLDGNPGGNDKRPIYSERYIHAAIYRARPDVAAVIHSHSPNSIPFGVTNTSLRPVVNTSAFLGKGVARFDLADTHGVTNLMITDASRGDALAHALGAMPVVLLRGHGLVVVAGDLRRAVTRAVYTEENAKILLLALSLRTPIHYLSAQESLKLESYFDAAGPGHATDRAWNNFLSRLNAAPGSWPGC